MCLHRSGPSGSSYDPFKLCGGSITIEVGERSEVFRSFTMNACPPGTCRMSTQLRNDTKMNRPIALPLPGKI